MLTIPDRIAEAVAAHVIACYPGEGCGLLFAAAGRPDAATRFLVQENLADRLHARDPDGFPWTSRNYFAMNEAKVARAVREAEAAGERWLAIVHSHIDCGAYFSAEDKAAAAPDGQCVYPHLWQVVVDVRADGIREARAFRWDGRDFADHGAVAGFGR